jgi:hypothetical protein
MRNYKKLGKIQQKDIQHRIYLLEDSRLQEGITLPEWFIISKEELTDLVQIGSFPFHNKDTGLVITVDMVECYQEVHIWKSAEKENHPQNLNGITAQEALSHTTGIQVMEDAMGSFDEKGDLI